MMAFSLQITTLVCVFILRLAWLGVREFSTRLRRAVRALRDIPTSF